MELNLSKLVSIIVPIYNAEKTIEKCAKSILDQSYKNIQVILINDGSTDNSLSICKKIREVDSRVIVVDKPNEGVSSARNCGIDIADGEYIGFVDSDDHIEEGMYETLITRINEDDSQCATLIKHTIFNPIFTQKTHYPTSITGQEALEMLFKLEFPTSLWAYLYKRETIKGVYLNRDIHFFEDFEFNFYTLTKCKKVSLCHDKLYNYETNNSSINSQKISYKKLSSLEIYQNISTKIKSLENRELTEKAVFFRSHFIASILSSLGNKYNPRHKLYYKTVKAHSRDILFTALRSDHVPKKYKLIIFAGSTSIRFFVISTSLLKKICHLVSTKRPALT